MITCTEPFIGWPKISRLRKEALIITEKIDGTNAQIVIRDDAIVAVGSRNRWITPEDDNYGFAKWVSENEQELLKLGHGTHFGEWWGCGIQRGYGLKEKRFSLFNTFRPKETLPACVHQVPILYLGDLNLDEINNALLMLMATGSQAEPSYLNPEGIVVYFPTSKTRYKVLLENDDKHKGELN